MANGNGYTAEELIDAIEKSRGYVTKAAYLLGCSRSTFYVYLKRFKTAQQALEDVREARHDHVESKLMELIDGGNVAATIFYLKTQCKHRGYVERQEISGPDEGPIVLTWPDGTTAEAP